MHKQTFVIKLDGLTAVGCCWQIALVNSTCNIHLVLQFCLRSSYEQSAGETPRLVRNRVWCDVHKLESPKPLLTGSFWQDSAAGGRQRKIQTGSLGLHFSLEHFVCPDWTLRPAGATHSTGTPGANTLPCFLSLNGRILRLLCSAHAVYSLGTSVKALIEKGIGPSRCWLAHCGRWHKRQGVVTGRFITLAEFRRSALWHDDWS